MASRHLVVSAVNFSEGGPLTVLLDSLDAAVRVLGPEWRITALVHDSDLVNIPGVETIAFPQSKRSWLTRLQLEWREFRLLSAQWKPDLWLSLHDMTPRVIARRQAVYCHNPSPFYRASLVEARYDPRFFLFNKFYMLLYRAFIARNFAVIVQQSWIRDAFRKVTGHPHIIVARPGAADATDRRDAVDAQCSALRTPQPGRPLRLLYPALPRVFKNAETLCEAVSRLPDHLASSVDLRLTFDGTENGWARELARRYNGVRGISLIGRQDRSGMTAEYQRCDAVLFPSRLETWGLPITEAKSFGKPLLAADLPYAHETVGDYGNVRFVAANDVGAWTEEIAHMASGRWEPQDHQAIRPSAPYLDDWPSLWRYLAAGL